MAALTLAAPRLRRLLPLLAGAVVVVATVLTVGAGPFLRGLAAVSPGTVLAATVLTGIATLAAAARWRTVARGLGIPLSWGAAIAAYYRSQFLNTVLPGGVLGDVHRAYRHGRGAGQTVLAARAVATERVAGQVVQLALVAVVLTALGLTTPLRGMAWVAGVAAALVVAAVAVAALIPRGRRLIARELAALRRVFGAPRAAFAIAGSSGVVLAAHATTFVVACLAVGVVAAPRDLVALALVALTAASLPVNVGGWGPREVASASAFALVGLGAGAGLAASTAFGVLTMIAVVPGAVVLLADRFAGSAPASGAAPVPVTASVPASTIAAPEKEGVRA